jgi:hypothetical protein
MWISKIFKKIVSSREEKSRKWKDNLLELGFKKISFPILIKEGYDLNLVYFDEFFNDPDLYYWQFSNDCELIDINGHVWSWIYDDKNRTNIPGQLKRVIDVDDLKRLIQLHFISKRIKVDNITQNENLTTIEQVYNKFEENYKR